MVQLVLVRPVAVQAVQAAVRQTATMVLERLVRQQ